MVASKIDFKTKILQRNKMKRLILAALISKFSLGRGF